MMDTPTRELTDDEIRLTRWLDGELGEPEVRDLIERDPELVALRQDMERIGVSLREIFPPAEEPPFPELFNKQILRKIEELPANRWQAAWRLFRESLADWMNESQWALPASASALLVVGLAVVTAAGSSRIAHSEVVHTYAPHPEHSVSTDFVRRAQATVIVLEGLEAVPDDHRITGFFRSGTETGPDAAPAAAVVYSLDGAAEPATALRIAALAAAPR
jgi:hypothetical protein